MDNRDKALEVHVKDLCFPSPSYKACYLIGALDHWRSPNLGLRDQLLVSPYLVGQGPGDNLLDLLN